MAAIDGLLARLEGVRSTGRGKWMARCPGHDDKRASLAVRERDDGVVLLHCFALCSVHEVLGAVGMNMADLFPAKLPQGQEFRASERRPWNPSDILKAVSFEALVAAVAAANIAQGVELNEKDRQRLMLAAERLQAASYA